MMSVTNLSLGSTNHYRQRGEHNPVDFTVGFRLQEFHRHVKQRVRTERSSHQTEKKKSCGFVSLSREIELGIFFFAFHSGSSSNRGSVSRTHSLRGYQDVGSKCWNRQPCININMNLTLVINPFSTRAPTPGVILLLLLLF